MNVSSTHIAPATLFGLDGRAAHNEDHRMQTRSVRQALPLVREALHLANATFAFTLTLALILAFALSLIAPGVASAQSRRPPVFVGDLTDAELKSEAETLRRERDATKAKLDAARKSWAANPAENLKVRLTREQQERELRSIIDRAESDIERIEDEQTVRAQQAKQTREREQSDAQRAVADAAAAAARSATAEGAPAPGSIDVTRIPDELDATAKAQLVRFQNERLLRLQMLESDERLREEEARQRTLIIAISVLLGALGLAGAALFYFRRR